MHGNLNEEGGDRPSLDMRRRMEGGGIYKHIYVATHITVCVYYSTRWVLDKFCSHIVLSGKTLWKCGDRCCKTIDVCLRFIFSEK